MTGKDAAATLGLSIRTIQRQANAGKIERTLRGRRSFYLVSAPVIDATLHATDDTRDATPIGDIDATDDTTGDKARQSATPDPTVIELVQLLAAAERRAAVAEYRVAIAEVDPAEVEALRADLETMTAERDEAREQGQRLADAMTKRHALIKRLTARLANA